MPSASAVPLSARGTARTGRTSAPSLRISPFSTMTTMTTTTQLSGPHHQVSGHSLGSSQCPNGPEGDGHGLGYARNTDIGYRYKLRSSGGDHRIPRPTTHDPSTGHWFRYNVFGPARESLRVNRLRCLQSTRLSLGLCLCVQLVLTSLRAPHPLHFSFSSPVS